MPKPITLSAGYSDGVTVIPNTFFDEYLPRANGEFLKIYLYLLRWLSHPDHALTLSGIADIFFMTENDVTRALKYWESEKLVSLTYTANQQLSGITLLEPFADAGHMESSASMEAGTTAAQTTPAAVSGNTDTTIPESSDYIRSLTPDRIKELKQKEEISQLLYIAEQYLAKTLTPTEMQKILFFYDELHMSADLIEYLVEYCVSRGRKSMRYIETVALAWAKDGVTTVEMARDASSRFSKDYYTILKAMGISGRNPVDNEITYIDTWRKTYGFDLDLIQEACSRTVLATGQPSFQYADKILSGWKKKNVHTLEDIRILDAEHKKRQLEKSVAPKKQQATQPQNNNRFNNFHQRDYDFAEYEKRLLNNQ